MKRLFLVVFAVAVIAAAMGAGTMAYFSASAASQGNSFTAGTMSFVIKDPDTSGHGVFNVTGMKPGQTVTGKIAVANDSSTGMDEKWRAYVTGQGKLGEVLQVKVTLNPDGASTVVPAGYTLGGPNTPKVLTDWLPLSALTNPNSTPLLWAGDITGPFKSKWYSVYQLEVRMDPNAGNGYQGTNFIGDVNFYATQYENPGW